VALNTGSSGDVGLCSTTQASWKYHGSKRSSYSRDLKNSQCHYQNSGSQYWRYSIHTVQNL